MKYRDIIGFSKKQPKKKVVKENKPSIKDIIKEEFKEYPIEMVLNEGPSYEYAKHIKKIDKLYDMYGAAVGDFEILLKKKGMKKEARDVKMMYGKLVFKFQKAFENFVRKLL